ncbi:hypothetical protein Tco_0542059 [Tanacetum coccineum]
MFKKLHYNISLAEALALMPKYYKILKDLLFDKEKLLGLANTSLTKNCSAVLLKKLPQKLGDPGKFLIPCDFPELEKCMVLADLAGIAEDVFIQVGKFTFSVDFVVVDYDVDPCVPLNLGRPFFRTALALVDVYREELILRDGDEKLIFHADSTSKHPHKHGNNLTPSSDLVVESLFPSLTPFGDIDLLLEETDAFLSLDVSIPQGIDNGIYDLEGDILFLEELLNDEILRDLHPKERKDDEPSTTKSLIKKPLGIDNEIYDSEGDILFLENLLNDDPIKDLPPHELNNDPGGDILFLEKLLKDEPLETERSEIYTLIGEPPDTFLMGDKEIKFNPFKDIDDSVPIPRVSETPLDYFDSSLDSSDTTFTNPLFELDSEYTLNYDNPIFDIQNEDSDAFKKETIIDEEVSESHFLDSFELGDENVVFDPGTIVIKGWTEHYYGGDIPAMDVPDLYFPPKDK